MAVATSPTPPPSALALGGVLLVVLSLGLPWSDVGSGAQSVARVFLVLALAVLAWGALSPRSLTWAAALVAAGVLLAGLGATSGQLAAAGAVALLAVSARRGRPAVTVPA